MQLCIDLFASGKLHPKNLITHNFPLEKINEAFQVDEDKKTHNSIFVALKN
jgi:Zn-dependent alcohol dehydrogenase